MRLSIQWTLGNPSDWIDLDLRPNGRVWENLPTKAVPKGGETIDNQPGWFYNLNVQGVEFEGFDHCAVRPLDDGIEVSAWNDDPEDFPAGQRFAHVWTFLPLRADPRYDGELNTEQYLTVYDEHALSPHEGQSTSGGPVVVRPWSEFVVPTTRVIHGIWVSDELAAAHGAAKTERGWRE